METDEGWVLLRPLTPNDLWTPSLMKSTETTTAECSESQPLKITFDGPAEHWTDAIPIGNGRLGAMIWGGVNCELIQLNEDTLWTGIPDCYTDQDAPKALSEVRHLVDDGKYSEATEAAALLFDKPAQVYQLLGDLKIEFDQSHLAFAKETYYRELDLDTATALVKYSLGDVEFTREYFSSNPDQVIVTKISGSKPGSLSFVVSLDSKLEHHSHVSGTNRIIMEGSCPGRRVPPKVNKDNNPKGIGFSAVLDLQISDGRGVIHVLDGNRLKVQGTDWAILFLAASSSFDGPFTNPLDSKKDPIAESLGTIKSIRSLSYSEICARHLDDYQNLFHRVYLQLSKSSKSIIRKESFEGSEKNNVSTAQRVKSFEVDEDPSLVALLFQFGRYLLISSSRPGTQVANLQGIWNKDLQPKWDSAPHLNINLEMNYWPSLPCNLSECQEPLFDFITSLSINGSKTAKVNYEAGGWVVHNKSDIWAKPSADRGGVVWAIWQMGGAWISTHLWEHYQYTLDIDFLRNKAYPLMEGCAKFLLDWLIEGCHTYLETNPSTSPEHEFTAPDGKTASISYSSTMDIAIIREVFSALVSAAKVLDKTKDALVQKVYEAYPRLPPTKISRDGSIMEWAEDFKDPDVHHRHLSHLFGLFPGHSVSLEETPDLCKAAECTILKRGEDGPGWSTTWKTCLWARLQNCENAYRMVRHLITLVDPDQEVAFEGGLYANLFAAHPPFQIDANFGFTAAIAEMLVQSTMKDLYLLPALPRDIWGNGCVKGLKTRGNITVNICWEEGELFEVGLWSEDQNSVKDLHYRGTTISANILSGRIYTYNRQLECVDSNAIFSEADVVSVCEVSLFMLMIMTFSQ
ncbi:alpha-L-fucosidase 2-like [Rutidosis leptorrhynchoides]|uniref:alpha-L-fucosidase 2-like n=1 Tax=Rutidosis leptorrhynchoides TaxID=125765 RepID=UPI003A98E2CC